MLVHGGATEGREVYGSDEKEWGGLEEAGGPTQRWRGESGDGGNKTIEGGVYTQREAYRPMDFFINSRIHKKEIDMYLMESTSYP